MDETPQGNEPAQKQPNVPPAPTPPLSSQLKLEESESMEQETRSRDESGSSDQQQTDQRAQSEAQASELQSSSTPSNQPSDLDGQNKTEEQRQQQQQQQPQQEPQQNQSQPQALEASQRQQPEELFSSANQGTTPIRHDAPWESQSQPTKSSTTTSAIGDRNQPSMQVNNINSVSSGQAVNALAASAAAAASAASSPIPDAVVHHFLNVAGMHTSDQRVIRLIAIAAQKFIHDIVTDSLQHCKLRGKKTKEKKYTLAIEDLASALAEYGIEVKRQEYFN